MLLPDSYCSKQKLMQQLPLPTGWGWLSRGVVSRVHSIPAAVKGRTRWGHGQGNVVKQQGWCHGLGGCGRGWLPSVLGAAWQAWPGPPWVGAWLPTYTRGGDRRLGRDGIVSSRSLCPVRWSQTGDGKCRALGSPCPPNAPSVGQGAELEHPGRQPGTRWAAPQGTVPARDSVPLLSLRCNISWRQDDSDIKIQHRFKNNTTPKVCFPQYRCSGLILGSPEHNLLC